MATYDQPRAQFDATVAQQMSPETAAATQQALNENGVVGPVKVAVDDPTPPPDTNAIVYTTGGTYNDLPDGATAYFFQTTEDVSTTIDGSNNKTISFTGSNDAVTMIGTSSDYIQTN